MLDKSGIRKESQKLHQKLHQKKVVAKTATSSAPNTAPICYLRVSKGFFCVKKKCLWKKKLRTDLFWHHQKVHQFCTPKKVSFGANPFRVQGRKQKKSHIDATWLHCEKAEATNKGEILSIDLRIYRLLVIRALLCALLISVRLASAHIARTSGMIRRKAPPVK